MDLQYSTMTFTPDLSSNFYSVCREPATNFPVNPAGGTVLPLLDDQFIQVTLTNGRQVSIYGSSSNALYIGANGNATFNPKRFISGMQTNYDPLLGAYFDDVRAAPLWADLNPQKGGTVSYLQLQDRFVVTWRDVPEFGTTNLNNVQLELWFNGVIRMTWLHVQINDPIDPFYYVGLSRGTGVPPDFMSSDLSAYDSCSAIPQCRLVSFTNTDNVRFAFPLIELSVTQTQFNLASVYSMHLLAAPVREFWFAATNSFAPTNGSAAVNAGDVLSMQGRTVKTNARLLQSIGLTTPKPTTRIDALDIAPGGEIFFSLNENVSSPTLGALQEGDLLSDRGRIVRTSQQLMAAFGIQPIVPDVGLDAVRVKSSGEILFSIRTNIFAEGKGLTLRRGDVLSSLGQIVKTNAQLLANFHPTNTSADYGLDALYVWPSGEMWFSTETGFDDTQLGSISSGDLLSTEGFIVFRNAELVAEFAAPQSVSGFGLSDIFVVTDVDAAPPPRFLVPRMQQNQFPLQWSGTNRVYLLERAASITGPWQPLGEINPGTSFTETNVWFQPGSFYRLQAW
jgi:hypothetical protein